MAHSHILQVKPALLSTLCMLSWTGSVLSATAALYSVSVLENARLSAPGLPDDLTSAWQNRWLMFGISIAGSVLCSIGAWAMWKRLKSGFFIYTTGEILPVVSAFIIGGNMVGCINGLFSALIALSFILLYASCLKHLH